MTTPPPTVGIGPTPSAPVLAKVIASAPRIPNRTRVLALNTAAPIAQPNPYFTAGGADPDARGNYQFLYASPADEAMIAAGAEAAQYVPASLYNGLSMFATKRPDDGNYVLDAAAKARALDYTRGGNHLTPAPDPAIAFGLGQLVTRTQHFFASEVKPYAPVILDAESADCPAYDASAGDPLAKRIAAVDAMTAVVKAVKQGAGTDDVEVGIYSDLANVREWFSPEPEMAAAVQRFYAVADVAVASLYFWDVEFGAAERWEGDLAKSNAQIALHCPHLAQSKLAFVSPVYQCFDASKTGQPVPIGTWQSQLERLVSEGWWLCVWMPGKFDAVEQHLAFAAKLMEG